jgi:hypothetical protein
VSDSRDFDPRFDPAFQRGYVDDGTPAPQKFLGIEALGLSSESGGLPPEGVEPTGTLPPRHPEPAVVSLEGNPWVKALWIIAPVLIFVGVVGQVWGQSQNSGQISNADVFTNFVLPQLMYSVCPGMIQVGLAALVGVVFLHAVRWRRAE